MFEKQKKQKKIYPLAVVEHQKKIVFFCAGHDGKKIELFLYKNAKDKLQRVHKLDIFSQDGEEQHLVGCGNFHFFQADNDWYVSYTREYTSFFRKKVETIIAKSKDLQRYEIIEQLEDKFPRDIAIVSQHKHRKNFLAYFGKKSIYVAASGNLEDWHVSGQLLAPRKDHFDSGLVRLLDAKVTERGILVLYEAKKSSQRSKDIAIGAAMFDLNQPYKVLWRSNEPIWVKNIRTDAGHLRYIGAINNNGILHLYWVSKKNEITSVIIKPSAVGIGTLRKAPSQLNRHHANPILKPNPENTWEYDATFNPAAIHLDDKVHLLYRAIGSNGLSVFGYASSKDGYKVDERLEAPAFAAMKIPKKMKEEMSLYLSYASGGSWVGCEDPRITLVGKRIYMTYIAFDGCNPPGVALTSISVKDFLKKDWKWKKPVLISKPGEIQKNWVLFPEKINGKYVILHSITPQIAVEYIDDLDKAGLVIQSDKKPGKDEHRWDNIVRGAGAPPIKTDYGWLVLYHAMDKRDPNRYKVGAMILDYNDPTKVLHRAAHPILQPDEHYENNGAKAGVVYVCGAVIKDETLFVYYGGADSVVCVATANINEFLKDITKEAANGLAVKEKIINKKSKKYVRSKALIAQSLA
jgi:predicted GH43/DUF377 family glycosyl hydrolase